MRNSSDKIFIGTMSGTSHDGIDICAIKFSNQINLLKFNSFNYPASLKKWILENKVVNSNKVKIQKSEYKSQEKKNLVKNKNQIDSNINIKDFLVVDARSKERFEGKVPDPRKNVRSGSIPNSFCLPFKEILNEDNTFKNTEEISQKFMQIIDIEHNNIVFSCGSGVTACVLALAYSLVNNKYSPKIYDGSWAEYGKI